MRPDRELSHCRIHSFQKADDSRLGNPNTTHIFFIFIYVKAVFLKKYRKNFFFQKIVVVGFLIDIPLLAPYLRFKRVSLFEWYNLLSLEF